jgi:hypothetical protein
MSLLRVAVIAASLAIAPGALAQDGTRGSVPPGESRDGAKPSDGALKGGTILPGESSGIPDRAKMERRCDELSGTLREDCLKQEREAASGATALPPIDTRKPPPVRAD